MPDKKLMRLMIDCPGTYREVALSDAQLDLYKNAKSNEDLGVTSESVSDYFNISIQSASGRLATLCKKKYLRRVEGTHITGGAQHTYFPAL